jgi:hypothetical protein
MNKHLHNIINNYISHELPFLMELKKETKYIKDDIKRWIYYEQYTIKIGYLTPPNDPIRKYECEIGYKDYNIGLIIKYGGIWFITSRNRF